MKGISPLMAGVLMIAFTLAVAAIIGSWLTSISRTETAEVETGFRTTINCSKGVIDIVDVTCLASAPNEELTVAINNVGDVDLDDFSLSGKINVGGLFANATSYNLTLGRGQMGLLKYTFNNLTYNGTVKTVRVTAGNCPSVWAEISDPATCP